MRDLVTLYPGHERGSIRANRIGGFVRAGRGFDVIRPGYDAQGRRRTSWTQIVHRGVPVFEVKVLAPLDKVLERFDTLWDKTLGADDALTERALAAVTRHRLSRFRDGYSGVAQTREVSQDGRGPARAYPA